MLQVKLLGQFDLLLDGQPVELASRPAQSLLAYLVLTAGTAHRREKLAGLLWPDTLEASARKNLRQALWQIRKALGGRDYILADEITIAFDARSDYWLDAYVLEEKAGAECAPSDSVAAVSVYGGELLPGFYDEWVVLERQRLQVIFEHKMKRLLDCQVEAQRWEDVLEWGERWIALGHTPEPAYRALMLAHAGLGDVSSVAAVYRRCVEALRQELGVEPSDQTLAVYEQLTSQRPASHPAPLLPSVAEGEPLPVDTEAALATGEPPFMGLHYFDEADVELFFGRELLTAKLAEQVCSGCSLTVIVGASGSGKSSLVRAGLVPAVKSCSSENDGTQWTVRVITPTAHPLEALAASLTRDSESVTATATLMDDLAHDPRSLRLYASRLLSPSPSQGEGRGGGSRFLLVVDQFEELFTLCRSEAERKAFVDNLLMEVEAGGPSTVVITLRADFYAHCAQYPSLREALVGCQEYIGPMNAEELHRAIEEPARRGGWVFEPGLVDLILRDVGDEPGALPLLSHALLETWKRRRGRTLTLAGYAESGGVRGAIAKTAESVYQRLSPKQQQIARSIFLRLTELGEGTQDTRRRAAPAELVTEFQDTSAVEAVLKTLADARLITAAEETVEVAHEALIREWPTLRQWLTEDREALRLHRHLGESARAWGELERHPGELYRGMRLLEALEWRDAHAHELNALERAFLDASQELAEQEAAQRQAQQQRELEAAQTLAEAHRQRAEAETRRAEEQARSAGQLRRRALFLTGALVMAGILAAVAFTFGRQASQSAQQAEKQARIARSREWAAAALASLDTDPERSVLLALQAVRETYAAEKTVLPEAQDALHRAAAASRVRLTLSGHTASVQRVIFSPDGTRLATISLDKTAKMWDAATGQLQQTLTVHISGGSDITFSPDGKRLATASLNDTVGTVKVWDVATGQQLPTVGYSGTAVSGIGRVTFSPDGTRLATAGDDGVARVWDVTTGQELLAISRRMNTSRAAGPMTSVAFSPDGTRLATASESPSGGIVVATAQVWDATTGQELLTLTGHIHKVNSVVFSPDGKLIATAGDDSTAKMWDAATGNLIHTLYAHTAEVVDVAFSPDGTRLATASLDTSAKMWDVASGRELLTLSGHAGGITAVAFSPDGLRLATSSLDGTARVWDITPNWELVTLSSAAGINGVAYGSLDGKPRLATAGQDGTVQVWDAVVWKELFTLSGRAAALETSGPVNSVAFSPDGKRLAMAGAGADYEGVAKVWNTATGKELFASTTVLDQLTSIAFSPECVSPPGGTAKQCGKHLATGSLGKTAKMWDAFTGQELLTLSGHSAAINTVAFSPDGKRIATGSREGMIKVWEADTGVSLFTLTAHADSIWSVAFSPDGKRFATGSRDGKVKVWDATTGRLMLTLSGHAAEVRSVAFSPDGKLIATGSGDRTARIWDATSGEALFTLHGHTDLVSGVAFSPDGSRLATSSYDGTVRLYVLRIEDLIALAKARVTRSLTSEECRTFLHLDRCP